MNYKQFTAVYVFSLIFGLGACSTGAQVKTKIAHDLYEIVEYQDCPTVCDALKTYLRTKLGVEAE